MSRQVVRTGLYLIGTIRNNSTTSPVTHEAGSIMSPIPSRPIRLAVVTRFGSVLTLLALSFLAGCARLGGHNENVSLAPTLEMGQKVPARNSDTESFALTNEGRHIEDRLLDRRRGTLLPD